MTCADPLRWRVIVLLQLTEPDGTDFDLRRKIVGLHWGSQQGAGQLGGRL